MAQLKPYPKYKDSGVEWIGEVPEEWKLVKIKFISKLINGYSFNSDEYVDAGIPIIRIGDIAENIKWENTKKISEKAISNLERFLIQKKDILIAMTGATIGKTAVFTSEEKALLNQRVGIIRARKRISENFLAYMIYSSVFKDPVKFLCYGGAQENIGTVDIGNIHIPFPNKQTQEKISTFLNKKTTQIDSLIDDKKRLIKLIKEKRQAVITETVTKGLDPNVKMKDSGIESIGEIPEHWEMIRLKHVGEIIMGQSPEAKSVNDKQIGYPFLQGNAEFKDLYPEAKHHCDKPTKLSKQGDILLSVRAPVGAMNWSDKEYVIGRGLCSIRVKDNTEPNFLWYALSYLRIELYSKMTGSTFEAVTLKDVRELYVMQPSFKEQQEISIYLSTLDKRINDLKQAITEQIIKLKEYRESLIYEAVTGKIDLRDYEVEHTETQR